VSLQDESMILLDVVERFTDQESFGSNDRGADASAGATRVRAARQASFHVKHGGVRPGFLSLTIPLFFDEKDAYAPGTGSQRKIVCFWSNDESPRKLRQAANGWESITRALRPTKRVCKRLDL